MNYYGYLLQRGIYRLSHSTTSLGCPTEKVKVRNQKLICNRVHRFPLQIRSPYDLVKQVKELGRLPVVNFAAEGGEVLDLSCH